MQLSGKWVLVTGASSGLGREIARRLASAYGANLVISARRKERLDDLAEELRQAYSVKVSTVVADLTNSLDVDRLFVEASKGPDLYAAVLNAGTTFFGDNRDLDGKRFQELLATNVTSSVQLCSRLIPYLLDKGTGGGLLLVTSLAGLIPLPYQTAYSASKAFMSSYGQGLYQELAEENISITTFAPGGIDTEMIAPCRFKEYFSSKYFHSAESCAKDAVRAMVARKYLVVPGLCNRFQLLLPRLLPRKFATRTLASIYRKALAYKNRKEGACN